MFTEAHQLMGTIATFYPNPGDVVGCAVIPGAKQLAGQVTGATRAPDTLKGKLPDWLLNVTGRSGKSVRVSVVENHVRLYFSWAEAMEAAKDL